MKPRDKKIDREPNELGRVSRYPVEYHRVGLLGRLPEKAVGLAFEYLEFRAGNSILQSFGLQ